MSAPLKLAGFAAVLALVFGIATVAGGAVGPDRADDAAERAETGGHDEDAAAREPAHGDDDDAAAGGAEPGRGSAAGGAEPAHSGDDDATDGHSAAADPVRGLAVVDDGLRLALDDTDLPRGRAATLRFTIREGQGAVRDFEVEHEKRMHLIVVRRDGTGFQHLHPELAADGTWSTPITLPEAGAYRVFADFKREGEAQTLAGDLTVDGDADYRPLPARTDADTTDGYAVKLAQDGSTVGFTITKDGRRIETEPYLGAGGHLVALREGDLAYLHVHPSGAGVEFETELDPASRYRLYLQFKHEGRIHTAEFTR